MFRGRSVHTLDAKGRIRIPSRFRDILKSRYHDRLIVTNFDRCLTAYPLQEWERIEERLAELSFVRQDVKTFQRFFISGARSRFRRTKSARVTFKLVSRARNCEVEFIIFRLLLSHR